VIGQGIVSELGSDVAYARVVDCGMWTRFCSFYTEPFYS